MKRSEAANRLAEFLADLLNKHPLDSEGGFKILPILDFLEKEIGMRPPFNNDPYVMDYGWGKEMSDREREFQSKRDSCI